MEDTHLFAAHPLGTVAHLSWSVVGRTDAAVAEAAGEDTDPSVLLADAVQAAEFFHTLGGVVGVGRRFTLDCVARVLLDTDDRALETAAEMHRCLLEHLIKEDVDTKVPSVDWLRATWLERAELGALDGLTFVSLTRFYLETHAAFIDEHADCVETLLQVEYPDIAPWVKMEVLKFLQTQVLVTAKCRDFFEARLKSRDEHRKEAKALLQDQADVVKRVSANLPTVADLCRKVLAAMERSKTDEGEMHFQVFAEVPDETAVPDYRSVVATPMAFSVIRRKIESGAYSTLSGCLADAKLIVANAMLYNEPMSWVYGLAAELAKVISGVERTVKLEDKVVVHAKAKDEAARAVQRFEEAQRVAVELSQRGGSLSAVDDARRTAANLNYAATMAKAAAASSKPPDAGRGLFGGPDPTPVTEEYDAALNSVHDRAARAARGLHGEHLGCDRFGTGYLLLDSLPGVTLARGGGAQGGGGGRELTGARRCPRPPRGFLPHRSAPPPRDRRCRTRPARWHCAGGPGSCRGRRPGRTP